MKVLNNWSEYSDFVDELYADGYQFHHSVLKQGYISRQIAGEVNYYNGRYGEGYTIEKPILSTTHPFTTRYHTIQYYVRMG